MKQFDPSKTVILIDGSSFLYRAYYALKPMQSPQGMSVHAVYGFCRMLKKVLTTFSPAYCAIAWDSKGPSVRAQVYADYKATRQAAPSDLHEQKLLIREFVDLINITQLEQPGIEADDLLYSAVQRAHADGLDVIIVTTDKDLGQVLDAHTVMYDSFKEQIITREALEQKYGFSLEKLPFYFALIGDSSDNIPGVKGIGPKTATELVQQFASLEDLYTQVDRVARERTRQLLLEHKDDAFMSEQLFILRSYELPSDARTWMYDLHNWTSARHFFERLAFKSLLKELPAEQAQQTLFEQPKPPVAQNYRVITVTTSEQLQDLVHVIRGRGAIAVDTETDSREPLRAHLVGISICYEQDTAYYIPCGHQGGGQLSLQEILQELGPVFADPKIFKCMHNAKFDVHVLQHAGFEIQGLSFDTMIAASLVVQDGQRIGLKYLSEHYLNETMISFKEVVTDQGYQDFSQVPVEQAAQYAAADAHQTYALATLLQEELRAHHQDVLYKDIEFPLVSVLCAVERAGIFCDKTLLHELGEQLAHDLHRVRKEIIALIGEHNRDINLNSPKQLSALLFEQLGLSPVKKTGKKTGYSTDQEVLQELARIHPVPALIVAYRELFKLKSTYVDALPDFINPETGRIHTTLSQTAAATGRLASFDPNLQNVPVRIRAAFQSKPGFVFLSADYSQIELRVLAYLSQDATLLRAFAEGEDVHKRTASALFEVPFDAVTSEQRQVAKRINFSILYGMTPYGLSKDLHISFADAKLYIDRFMAQYPGVQAWMERVIIEAREHGYVTTLWGRRRPLAGIYEKNKSLYEAACRIAINTKGQGTAAELMKLGMIVVYNTLLSDFPRATIVLQIHDELLFEVPAEQADAIESRVRDVLTHVVTWNVPLEVTTRTGSDWGQVSK